MAKKKSKKIINNNNKENFILNKVLLSLSIFLIGLLLMSNYITNDNFFESIFYYIIQTINLLFARSSYMLFISIAIINFIIIKRRKGLKNTFLLKKIFYVISFFLLCIILTVYDIGEISQDNIIDAGQELLKYAFEYKGAGILGAVLTMPFYNFINNNWFFSSMILLFFTFFIIASLKSIRLIYLLIKRTLDYYYSEEYENKKKVLEAKKEYEKKLEEIKLKEEEEKFTTYFIKLKDDKLDKKISEKTKDDIIEFDNNIYYSKKELEQKQKEWMDYYNKIQELKEYEKEKKLRKARQLENQNSKIEKEEENIPEKKEEIDINTIYSVFGNNHNSIEENNFEEDEIIENIYEDEEELEIENFEDFIENEEKVEETNTSHIKEVEEISFKENKYFDNIDTEDKEDISPLINRELQNLEMYNSFDSEELNKSIEEIFKHRSVDPEKQEQMRKEIEKNINLLETVLKEFGVDAKVVDYATGPTITRYEIKIPTSVRVKRVTELENEIKMKLRAESIRIEAPIPGKDAIGIETPNKIKEPVYFSNLIHSEELNEGTLPVILGKNIVGKERIVDIVELRHLLIAGTTGSGKSIAINTMIASLISKKSDEEVKFIMIDPKMVELMPYNGIPHLLTPVIIDPNQAAIALKWAVNEMEERYKRLHPLGLKNIEAYNLKYKNEKMPYIVIIIDELADLMMVASNNVEQSIARIAQKARAIGIHLIVATQRPSVDVVTGLIKANLPSRISCALRASQDSRTILDQNGAEKLLGKGDMLFLDNGKATLERLQGAYISDEEVIKLTDMIKSKKTAVYNDSILIESEEEDDSKDALFNKAVEFVKTQDDRVSISAIQRELKVGFNRAVRICDELKKYGILDEENRYTNLEIY